MQSGMHVGLDVTLHLVKENEIINRLSRSSQELSPG